MDAFGTTLLTVLIVILLGVIACAAIIAYDLLMYRNAKHIKKGIKIDPSFTN
jgi:hypothetical protein